ncbi:hypothetical protein [Shewanella sp. SNU WT4]|uniref:hypothetical protein n=1 Tax=Shewanella sp. SNU WT4 TaxID=2590015 RepID=UPI00197F98AC|nr:hypothetical protein [Shewanella sp. SNU WT4]
MTTILTQGEGQGRLIAIDMIGMGDSDKLDNTEDGSYSLKENTRYTSALLKELGAVSSTQIISKKWNFLDWR